MQVLFSLITLGTFLSGCAIFSLSGRVEFLGPGDKVTIEELEQTWQDYRIFYGGYYVGDPIAILFDPKKNDTTLVPEKWTEVHDKETLRQALMWVKVRTNVATNLMKITGADGLFYGYVYTTRPHLYLKPVDNKTLYVYTPTLSRHLDRPEMGDSK